jgi:hypothetical protein
LHGPIAHLKSGNGKEDDDLLYVAALKKLFSLENK